ncbi:MAG TPA: murein L,D-transpeptidase catalytic domain family protein [Segetibacter sp.]|jgi:hypothetical protein
MVRFFKFLPGIMIAAVLSASTPTFANDGEGLPGDKNFPSLISNSSIQSPAFKRLCDSIYDKVGLLPFGLERAVFYKAYKGYQYLLTKNKLRKSNLLTICDYSQSSTSERLYVIDLKAGKLLYNTFVAHGKYSGEEFATSFSNMESSNKSSLGFMVTAETYVGRAGLSMRFDGVERGINDQVRSRDIVLHGSTFVSRSLMGTGSSISKSLGCPAVPFGIHKKIIETIKGGSCFYVNHSDMWYSRTSQVLNAQFEIPALATTLAIQKTESPINGGSGTTPSSKLTTISTH